MVGFMLLLAVVVGVVAGVAFDSVLLALVLSTGILALAAVASYRRLTSQRPPPPPPPEE